MSVSASGGLGPPPYFDYPLNGSVAEHECSEETDGRAGQDEHQDVLFEVPSGGEGDESAKECAEDAVNEFLEEIRLWFHGAILG